MILRIKGKFFNYFSTDIASEIKIYYIDDKYFKLEINGKYLNKNISLTDDNSDIFYIDGYNLKCGDKIIFEDILFLENNSSPLIEAFKYHDRGSIERIINEGNFYLNCLDNDLSTILSYLTSPLDIEILNILYNSKPDPKFWMILLSIEGSGMSLTYKHFSHYIPMLNFFLDKDFTRDFWIDFLTIDRSYVYPLDTIKAIIIENKYNTLEKILNKNLPKDFLMNTLTFENDSIEYTSIKIIICEDNIEIMELLLKQTFPKSFWENEIHSFLLSDDKTISDEMLELFSKYGIKT